MFNVSQVVFTASFKSRFRCFAISSTLYVTCSCFLKSSSDIHMFTVDYLLSDENRKKCVNRLKSIKPFRIPADKQAQVKKAAVLVPFCTVMGELSLVYTVRSVDLKRNRGQISFPGGMNDESDSSLEETAIRETEEELGVSRHCVDIIGSGSLFGTHTRDTAVLPVLGFLGEIDISSLNVNREEVESVFTVSLKELCDPKCFHYTQFRNSFVLPVFIVKEHRIWGLTAMITHIVLSAFAPDIYRHKLFLKKFT